MSGRASPLRKSSSPNGTFVRDVELQPTKLNYGLTPLQKQILLGAIYFLGEEERCVPLINEILLPEVRALDFHAIAQLRSRRHRCNRELGCLMTS
jgi:hypothetical protein